MNNTSLFIPLVVLMVLTSCVSKSEYEKLKEQNKNLEMKVSTLTAENEELSLYKIAAIENEKEPTLYTEADVLRFLKDYYEFYHADDIYRKPRVRKISNSVFKIALEECTKKGPFKNDNFFWRSAVLSLSINNDGSYKFDRDYK